MLADSLPVAPELIGQELIEKVFGFEVYAASRTQLTIGLPFVLPIGLEHIFIQFLPDSILVTDLGGIKAYLSGEELEIKRTDLQCVDQIIKKYDLEYVNDGAIGKRISYVNEQGDEKSIDELVGDVVDAVHSLVRLYILVDAIDLMNPTTSDMQTT